MQWPTLLDPTLATDGNGGVNSPVSRRLESRRCSSFCGVGPCSQGIRTRTLWLSPTDGSSGLGSRCLSIFLLVADILIGSCRLAPRLVRRMTSTTSSTRSSSTSAASTSSTPKSSARYFPRECQWNFQLGKSRCVGAEHNNSSVGRQHDRCGTRRNLFQERGWPAEPRRRGHTWPDWSLSWQPQLCTKAASLNFSFASKLVLRFYCRSV